MIDTESVRALVWFVVAALATYPVTLTAIRRQRENDRRGGEG